jgi:hypothetical protein
MAMAIAELDAEREEPALPLRHLDGRVRGPVVRFISRRSW